MQRHIYRLIAMILLFIGCMAHFTGQLKVITFKGMETTTMSEASFPTITIKAKDNLINELHGYSANMDPATFRESLTPIGEDGYFYAIIDEHETNVKRLLYEIWDGMAVNMLDSGSISALSQEDGSKAARIRLKTDLTEGGEYFIKLTTVSATGKKIRFYTRAKYITEDHFDDNLDFVMNFHNALFDKDRSDEVRPYLESDAKADNSSYAYVNIKSSLDNVMWGELNPRVTTNIVPIIAEDNANTTSVSLKYMINADTNSGNEDYFVTEFYRVQWTANAMYLLTYERHTESVFNPENTSLAKSELKLGISEEEDFDIHTATDYSKLCFVKERELWYYNAPENACVCVFSFRHGEGEDGRNIYDQHNIRVLRMDDSGNIDFMVYGYMNRGVYEGKSCIVLYKYYSGEDRIEEQVYIPLEISYQMLKEDLDSLSYVNAESIFYFSLNSMLYSYNIITKQLNVITDDINKNSYIFFRDLNSVVWQEASDVMQSGRIIVMNLETGDKSEITAPSGSRVKLMGHTYNNMIYGFAKQADITKGADGYYIFPAEHVIIAGLDGNILKDYSRKKGYVKAVTTEENVICLKCIGRTEDGFVDEPDDHILNMVNDEQLPIDVSRRITELMLTEQYISLPVGFNIEKIPEEGKVVSTVITSDTTLRLKQSNRKGSCYYTYIYGQIQDACELASTAIKEADEKMGIVINEANRIVWERGGTGRSALISDIKILGSDSKEDSVYSCIRMIMKRKYADATNEELRKFGTDPDRILRSYLPGTTVNLTGAELNEVLYYVSKGMPVMVLTGEDTYSLIVGYDEYGLSIIDAVTGTKITKSREAAEKAFLSMGNVYIVYID